MQSQRGTASNHYDLLARLAGGGMAEIFLARANGLEGFERYVVLKRIRPERNDDPQFVGMFLDEARLAAQLQHPNIAQVFDLGRIGDDYFYTMEYVHGRDVLETLARHDELGTKMPLSAVLAIIVGAAAGLAHAHERKAIDGKSLNIVHRDVSPSNLMVSFEGTVKVLDFGIAKARFRQTETQAGTIMGKVAYLSPEQCRTGIVDHRSDIFSLGVVFWEMLTNERAFKREADFDTLRAVVKDMPATPSSIVPSLPKAVDEIVMRCLAKDPDERYQDVAELIDDVEALAEAEGIALTAGVLRRHMKELFGNRPEPWQGLDGNPDVGLPLDATAADVPMLPATGLIDVSMLLSREDLMPLTPHHIPRGSISQDRSAHAQPYPATPLRIPTGSVPMVPIEDLLERFEPSAVMPAPAVFAQPDDGTGILLVPPRIAVAPLPKPTRRPWLIALIASGTVALALVLYVALGRGSEPPHVAAPSSSEPAAPAKPTATPIEVPAAAALPVESKPAGNPVETARAVESKPAEAVKPVESKPVESKPAEAKPVESKPIESKPAVAVKPVETKPAVAAKPVETKPVESKPAVAAKPVETKPTVAKPVGKPKVEPVKPETPKPETKPEPKPAKPECDDPMRCQFY